MSKRMVAVVRIAFGLLLVAFFVMGVSGWKLPEVPSDAKALRDALLAAGYFFPTIITVYLLVGIAYLTNRFVSLATLVLVPITVNVLLYHLFLAPSNLPLTAVLIIPNAVMIYACREAYQPLLRASS